jgi:ABC-type multidrug transport system fused ATPase/permease subunit
MATSVLIENEALMNGYVPYYDHRHYSNNHFHVNASGLNPITLPDVHEHPLFYVGVYAMIGFATAIVSVLSTAIQYNGALKASRSIFHKLLTGVVRATMRWHDVTPAGRMLNRFGKVRLKVPWFWIVDSRMVISRILKPSTPISRVPCQLSTLHWRRLRLRSSLSCRSLLTS